MAVCRNGDPVPEALRDSVTAIGNFDGVHLGHQALIREAMEKAEHEGRPSGVLTFEPHPRAFFDPGHSHFRITPGATRLKLFARLGLDAVFLRRFDAAMAGTAAEDFVGGLLKGELAVSAIVVGTDFHFGRGRSGTPAVLRELGMRFGLDVCLVEAVAQDGASISSSRIRAALEDGDIGLANALLGYRWFVAGEVVHGDKRGRTLGFPTANVRLEDGCRLKYGIYAVRMATAAGAIHGGVASFGRRPTFDNGAPLLETYLFDFSGDLYGRTVEVEFVAWIRGEERFASADALVARMETDKAEALEMLRAASSRAERSVIG